jgi:4'-phosphopantetheinyl transferase
MAGERDGGVASGSQADHPARLRWAVNTERWNPEGDHEGAEFTFLLSLLPQHEREDCLRFVHMPDKKRALVSRLLQRAA